ncbi:MAG: DUF3089 domain-containing protein [Chloroflexota bacterium]
MIRSTLRLLRHPLVLTALGLIVAIILMLGYIFQNQLRNLLGLNSDRPNQRFAAMTPPPSPDYALNSSWLALPDIDDPSDLVPVGFEGPVAAPEADVFWVHPTTYFAGSTWNQPIDAPDAHEHLSTQASIFNDCCAVYAPRYRQAIFLSFFELDNDGGEALDLAYQDVVAAFNYYLENDNNGRPFILAGHSQGSILLERLIREELRETPLEAQLIAAYLVGHDIEPDTPGGLPICVTPDQTGCQIAWNALSYEIDASDHSPTQICVNPLTWTTDGQLGEFAANRGTIYLLEDNSYELETGIADAQCVDGQLRVSEVRSEPYAELFGDGYYHEHDYAMFYVNTRRNAADRVAAFLSGP